VSIDQLWFGWAAHGAEGLNKQQIIAASGVLDDRTQQVTRDVLSACYAPADTSFGWLDRGAVRLAFRRARTGLDGRGRPGNFFVHVLLGDRETLTVETLARLWGAGVWVERAPEDPPAKLDRLDSLDGLQLAPSPRIDDEAFTRTLAGYLANAAGARHTAISLQGAELVAAAARIAEVIPQQLGLPSFSTGEEQLHAHEYDVVGGSPPSAWFSATGPEVDPGDTWSAAARLVVSSVESQPAADAVAAIADRSNSVQEFARGLRYLASVAGGTAADREAGSDAVAYVAADPRLGLWFVDGEGLDLVAREFAGASREALGLLKMAAAEGRGSRVGVALSDAIRSVPPPGGARRLVELSEAVPSIAGPVIVRAVDEWSDAELLSRMAPSDASRLLASLTGNGSASERAAEQLLKVPSFTSHVAASRQLPATRRAQAVAHNPTTLDPRDLAAMLAEVPGFASALLRSADRPVFDAVGAALRMAPIAEAQRAAVTASACVSPEVGDRWLMSVCERIGEPLGRYDSVCRMLEGRPEVTAEWAHRVLDWYGAAVLDLRDQGKPLPWLSSASLRATGDPRVYEWHRFHADLDEARVYGVRFAVPRAVRRATDMPRRDADAAQEVAVDTLLRSAARDEDSQDTLDAVAYLMPPEELARRAARAALRLSGAERPARITSLIGWVAARVASGRMDQDVVRLPPLDALGHGVDTQDARAWLHECRKRHKKTRPLNKWLGGLEDDADRALRERGPKRLRG
jgi:hypothetical protein